MKITDEEFSAMEMIIKKSCIGSKIFQGKMKEMRTVILKMSELRDFIVYDEKYVENDEEEK